MIGGDAGQARIEDACRGHPLSRPAAHLPLATKAIDGPLVTCGIGRLLRVDQNRPVRWSQLLQAVITFECGQADSRSRRDRREAAVDEPLLKGEMLNSNSSLELQSILAEQPLSLFVHAVCRWPRPNSLDVLW